MRGHLHHASPWTRRNTLLVVLLSTSPAWGQTATRSLSDFAGLNQTFTVSISVTPPPGTIAFGVEDAPPDGWTDVANIDNGGSWDPVNTKVKWGPFFSDDPVTLSYDLTPPASPAGAFCFFGFLSLDGNNEIVGGDVCVPRPVPAASAWGLLCFVLAVLIAGSALLRARTSPRVNLRSTP